MIALAHLDKELAECLPSQLWLSAEIQDHVVAQVRGPIGEKLACRPDDIALDPVSKLDGRSSFRVDQEFFNINFCDQLWFPEIGQVFDSGGGCVGGIIPTRQSRD